MGPNSSNQGGNNRGKSDFMQEFFSEVEVVKANIVVIKESTRKIAEINQNVLQATTNEREQDFSNELGNILVYSAKNYFLQSR